MYNMSTIGALFDSMNWALLPSPSYISRSTYVYV
jgi:hypothetical protein